MCIRDRVIEHEFGTIERGDLDHIDQFGGLDDRAHIAGIEPVSYTHLRAHETVLDLVCRLLLDKKNQRWIQTFHCTLTRPRQLPLPSLIRTHSRSLI